MEMTSGLAVLNTWPLLLGGVPSQTNWRWGRTKRCAGEGPDRMRVIGL